LRPRILPVAVEAPRPPVYRLVKLLPSLDLALSTVAERLSSVVDRLNEDRVGDAECILIRLKADHPDLPQATMLMGIVRLRQKRFEEAKACFNLVLRGHPNQPTTLFHLANALVAQNDLQAAIATYRKAVAARPNYQDAQLALASALSKAGDLQEAQSLYRKILERTPDAAEAILGLGDVLVRLEEFTEAENILAMGERLRCGNALAAEISERLGTSKMLTRRYFEALPHLERALVLTPDSAEVLRKRATVLEHLRQPRRAAAGYREVLKQNPEDLKTHLLLNELIHREWPDSELLASYDEAARRVPASAILPAEKADLLMLLERPAEAAEAYRRALRLEPAHLPAQIGLARALDKLGEQEAASAAFEAGLRAHPEDPSLKTAFAFHLLRRADSSKAKRLAESAVRSAPNDQAALAVLGLCYRATNDARDEDLNDYERFVGVFDLAPPDGYADMAAYHRDLRAHLDKLHSRAAQFFSQTLRGGTRAGEDVFQFHEKTRDLLKGRIAQTVSRYIAELPFRPGHAFLGRKAAGKFQFSGSWSSRMKGGGFHVNHIHNGWISSVYYVDVPDAAELPGHQGWLKFGEPSAEIGLQDPVRRLVQPRPGRLVLFPSYMWHGTVPFHSDEVRTTIAFDAIPFPAA
jgi:tetratricopeptide (TPR) repeat protein